MATDQIGDAGALLPARAAGEAVPAPGRSTGPVQPGEPVEDEQALTRRTFQTYVAASLSSFAAIVLGLPIVGYLAAPLVSRVTASWISLGRADAFAKSDPQLVSFSITRQDGWRQVAESRAVWVRTESDRTVAFNGRCTHLGCAFSWRTEGEHAKRFFCPCHDGVYDASGTVLAGPPPRALDRLETKVDNGELFVLYQDFRLGVADKESV